MLFNPDWNKKDVKADPFELGTLIAWLQGQYQHQRYDYRNCLTCMLARYFTEQLDDGIYSDINVSKNFVTISTHHIVFPDKKKLEMLPPFFNWIAEEVPHTMGAALKRAELARDKPAIAQREMTSRLLEWR